MPGGAHRRLPQRFLLPDAPLVRVVGRIVGADVEEGATPEEIDHIFYYEPGQETELFLFKFCGQP
ncbi:MAG: hypothetical protein WC003_12995 [Terrimicrobiaceae bacterium]